MEQLISRCSITKIHKIHAPKIQGRVFSEVAEAPQAAPTPRTLVGDLKPVTNVHFESEFPIFFSKMLTFQNVKIEILKCAWERFPHIQQSRYEEKWKIRKIQVWGPI